jgi:hypothetical protein
MNRNFRNKLLVAVVLATTAPLAMTGIASAQDQNKDQRAEKQQQREKAKGARQDAAASREEARQQQAQANQQQRQAAMTQDRGQREQHMQQAQAARQQQAVAEQRARERDAAANRAERQAAQAGNQAARQDNRAERQQAQIANQGARQDSRAARQQDQVANQAARQQARSDRRLSRAQQDQIINTQKARVNTYRTWTNSQRSAGQQYAATIQRQNRSAQYAYIQDYNNRYWTQQQGYMGMSLDYYNDPYFYSAPSYRYMRDGSWYTINQYGANLLQQAINDGYGEGYHAGRADRMDHWRFDYRSSYVYQNAAYGYNGYYGDRSEYTYYFRQGFRRGYEDGYYSRYQYGAYRNGNYSIVGTVLNTILGLQPYSYRY